jgi:hypothetical protein
MFENQFIILFLKNYFKKIKKSFGKLIVLFVYLHPQKNKANIELNN